MERLCYLRRLGRAVRRLIRPLAGISDARTWLLGPLRRICLYRDPWRRGPCPRRFHWSGRLSSDPALWRGVLRWHLEAAPRCHTHRRYSDRTDRDYWAAPPHAAKQKSRQGWAACCTGESMMELVRTEKLALGFGGVVVAGDIEFSPQ